MMNRILCLTAVGLIVATLSGCASHIGNSAGATSEPVASGTMAAPTGSVSAPSSFTPFAAPDVNYAFRYSDQLESAPIGSASVKTTPQQAIAAVDQQQPPDPDMQPGEPQVTLRIVSEGYQGQDSSYLPHPAWVLTWTGGAADVHGPPSLGSAGRQQIANSYRCIAVSVVDAVTLKVQGGMFQFCRTSTSPSATASPSTSP